MKQKRIKVRLTENSPYSDYGYYEKGDIGYIDGYVNDNAVIILENGKFAKADLRWIEVVNEEDKNVNTELRESEDERIRKGLIEGFQEYDEEECWRDIEYLKIKDILAWLEKQGEQKPSEDEDREYACQSSEHYTRRELMIYNLGIADGKRMIEDAIKETEQKPAWSEEDDEYYRNIIIKRLEFEFSVTSFDVEYRRQLYSALYWLKSLRPQNHWKPSESDIIILEQVIDGTVNPINYQATLHAILEQLKKLREE